MGLRGFLIYSIGFFVKKRNFLNFFNHEAPLKTFGERGGGGNKMYGKSTSK